MAMQLFSVDSLGGYLNNDALSKKIRYAAQPLQKFRQFVRPESMAGAHRGAAVFFNRISNISTAGGTLTETATIPQNNYTISQGTLTMNEWGNSIPFSQKVQVLSEITVPETIQQVLRDDMAKVLDSAVKTQFVATTWKAVCVNTATTSFTTNGTAAAAAVANMSDKNIRDIVDRLKKGNVPRYDGENYIHVGSTNSIRGLYDYFEAKAQNTTMAPLFRGEVGQYYGTRHIEETNSLSNTIGTGSVYGESVVFGADAVVEGIAVPEDIRIKIAQDYGRDQGIAWYFLGGWQIVWTHSAGGEARIIHVTST